MSESTTIKRVTETASTTKKKEHGAHVRKSKRIKDIESIM